MEVEMSRNTIQAIGTVSSWEHEFIAVVIDKELVDDKFTIIYVKGMSNVDLGQCEGELYESIDGSCELLSVEENEEEFNELLKEGKVIRV